MNTSAKSLAQQARIALRETGYDRKGGKRNRRQQLRRACAVADWIQQHCQVSHVDQLGKGHIIRFWKAHRELEDSTAYGYWCALRHLWLALGKTGQPPRPIADL